MEILILACQVRHPAHLGPYLELPGERETGVIPAWGGGVGWGMGQGRDFQHLIIVIHLWGGPNCLKRSLYNINIGLLTKDRLGRTKKPLCLGMQSILATDCLTGHQNLLGRATSSPHLWMLASYRRMSLPESPAPTSQQLGRGTPKRSFLSFLEVAGYRLLPSFVPK